MSYCTEQNLIDRFGEQELIQLTDRSGYQQIDLTVLNQAIADADAEINGYLTAYALPLVNVPANLVRIAGDIARYYLYADQPIPQVTQRYKDAIEYLKLIAKGTLNIAPDSNGTTTTEVTATVEFSSAGSDFARDAY